MRRLRLLDLYCGGGGAGMGYAMAGFDVTGVDHIAQPDYPFPIIRANALTVDLHGYDVIHASPPCKAHTPLRHTAREGLFPPPHADLIPATRERLAAAGSPYVIENVPGARDSLIDPITYCGSSFGLAVRRHRLFESNVPLTSLPCRHDLQPSPVGVYGTGGADANRAARGGGGGRKVAGREAADALGIDWTHDQRVLSQAIPPAYTAHIGAQLLALVERLT